MGGGASSRIYSYRGTDVNTYYLEEIEPDIRGLLKRSVRCAAGCCGCARRACKISSHPPRALPPPPQLGDHGYGWNGPF